MLQYSMKNSVNNYPDPALTRINTTKGRIYEKWPGYWT